MIMVPEKNLPSILIELKMHEIIPINAKHPKNSGTNEHSRSINSRSETNTASIIRFPPPTKQIPDNGSARTL